MAVPLAVLLAATSTHLPAMPVIGPTRCRAAAVAVAAAAAVPPVATSKMALTSEVLPVVSWDSSQFMMPPPLAMAHCVLRRIVGRPL